MAYSVSYVPAAPFVGMQPISTVSTVQNHPLGTLIDAYDATYGWGKFIYLKGVASTAQGSWVKYNADDFTTSLLAANDIGPVAVAMSATVASTYGWYQVYGKTVGKALTGYADNGLVYATATAGSIDDAVVAGDRVKNALGASALDTPATGFAEFEIQWPFMDDATAA